MPPSPSKTQHKKAGKGKVLDSEKKASSPGDSEICGGRLGEVKSKGQLKGKESLPKQDDSLEEDPLKSQRLVRLQGSKENTTKSYCGEEEPTREMPREDLFWADNVENS